MKNGRCRMHGGATPSHTATARARIAAARTKTGERTQEMRAHCENVAAFIRRNRIVVAMARLLILPIWETSLDLEQFAAYFSAQTPMRPENTESQARSSRHLSQQITDSVPGSSPGPEMTWGWAMWRKHGVLRAHFRTNPLAP